MGFSKNIGMFIWESTDFQVFLQRRKTTPNKECLGERIREKAQGQMILL